MKSNWQDCTSYSRGQERIPTAWRLDMGAGMQMVVVSDHFYHKGEWVLHCEPWFNTFPLGLPANNNAEAAQKKALAMVIAKVDDLKDCMDAFSRSLSSADHGEK